MAVQHGCAAAAPEVMLRTASRSVSGTPLSRSITITLHRWAGKPTAHQGWSARRDQLVEQHVTPARQACSSMPGCARWYAARLEPSSMASSAAGELPARWPRRPRRRAPLSGMPRAALTAAWRTGGRCPGRWPPAAAPHGQDSRQTAGQRTHHRAAHCMLRKTTLWAAAGQGTCRTGANSWGPGPQGTSRTPWARHDSRQPQPAATAAQQRGKPQERQSRGGRLPAAGTRLRHVCRLLPEVHLLQHGVADVAHDGCTRGRGASAQRASSPPAECHSNMHRRPAMVNVPGSAGLPEREVRARSGEMNSRKREDRYRKFRSASKPS